MKFGVQLPVKYRQGQPFDISLDDVQFVKPDIDVTSLLKGLVKKIA